MFYAKGRTCMLNTNAVRLCPCLLRAGRHLKTILLLVVIAASVIGHGSALAVGIPWDVRNHWASFEIGMLVNRGIVSGFEDGSFRPAENVTRAQFVKMLVLALGLEGEARRLSGAPPAFKDVPGDYWGKDYITLGWEMGIVRGDAEGFFHPEDSVNRMELAAMVIRAMGLEESADIYPADSLRFEDTANIPDWAKKYIAYAVKMGVIAGMPDNTFRPAIPAERAHAVVTIYRMLQAMGALYDVEGEITRIDSEGGRIHIKTASGGEMTVDTAPGVSIYIGRIPADTRMLRPGQRARMILGSDGRAGFVELEFSGEKVSGRVKTVNRPEKYLVIITAQGEKTCGISDQTLIIRDNGETATPDGVVIGDNVEAVVDHETGIIFFMKLK